MSSVKVSNAYYVFDKYYKDILTELYGPLTPKTVFLKAYNDGLTQSEHHWIITYL